MRKTLFSLSGQSLAEITKRTWSEINDADVFGRAAQLAYYFFLALFPFLISVIAALSVFGFADRGRELMFQFLASTLPPSAFDLISNALNDVIRASGPLKMSAGVLFSLWAASAGMRAVMDALNATYKVKEIRSTVKQYAVAVGLTLALSAVMVISVLVLVSGNTIINMLVLGNIVALLWKVVQWPVALALALLAFGFTYYYAPSLTRSEWHWVSPGAVSGVVLWILVSAAFRIYLHFFNSYSATYGSLGAVIILLLWFYLSGIALLSGAALNGVLERGAESAARLEAVSRGAQVANTGREWENYVAAVPKSAAIADFEKNASHGDRIGSKANDKTTLPNFIWTIAALVGFFLVRKLYPIRSGPRSTSPSGIRLS